jgi:hypothetical protein
MDLGRGRRAKVILIERVDLLSAELHREYVALSRKRFHRSLLGEPLRERHYAFSSRSAVKPMGRRLGTGGFGATTVQGHSPAAKLVAVSGRRRWVQSEEIGWAQSQEIRWGLPQETGWVQWEEIVHSDAVTQTRGLGVKYPAVPNLLDRKSVSPALARWPPLSSRHRSKPRQLISRSFVGPWAGNWSGSIEAYGAQSFLIRVGYFCAPNAGSD